MSLTDLKGPIWGTAMFWLIVAQLAYSGVVLYLGAYYAQKQWPTDILFGLVWHGHEGFSGLADMTMQTKKLVWHAFALSQAFTVGFIVDMVRKAAGITQGT